MPPLIDDINEVSLTPIQKFYVGSNIFITGGSGFLGRLLIEKLLRSCPDLGNVYVLIREKRNKSIDERIDEILNDCIFEKLKSSYPKYRYKVHGIEGDCSLPNLGINEQDRKLITTEISIVFHVAATVNFDEKLKTAVTINVKGTKEVINLCKEMAHLKAIVHVSTAYANCGEETIEEIFYPTPITLEQIIKITDILDSSILDKITQNILGNTPNTYAFTKAYAEKVVQEGGNDLPIAVYRPSIVISTYKEPLQGWINNLYGAVGVLAGAGTGVLRVLHCDSEVNANIVPADMCVNALVAIPWEIDEHFQICRNSNTTFDIPIYHYESSQDQPIAWRKYMKLNETYGINYPPVNAIWYYSLLLIKNYRLYQLAVIILHYIPAILADLFLCIIRKQPRFIKIYNKIHRFNDVISYFNTKNFIFKSTKVKNLITKMSVKDQNIFFCDMKKLDWNDYFANHFKGLRIYLLKDPLSTLPQAIKRWRRLYWCHQILKLIFGYILIRFACALLICIYRIFI